MKKQFFIDAIAGKFTFAINLLLVVGVILSLSSPLQANQDDLVITKLDFIRLTAESGKKSIYLTAETAGGHEGIYGPIDWEGALIADKMMKNKVIGRSALAHEAIWNDLFRANRHYRGSHYLIGMSAIDNVLWDLKGRIFNKPVYQLLGGDRKEVQAYGSCLGFSLEPHALQAKVRELKQEGFVHQKWFLRDIGPESGPAGLAKNVERIRLLREAMGPDGDLMIDVFSTWNLNYAASWCNQVEQYNLRWLEEALPSANLDGYIELSQETSVPLATGEHFYSRYDVQKFLERDAIRVIQADPEWCGGVSELVKICTIASVHGAQVIPHGHSMHAAMHVVASQDPQVCPLVEYLIRKMTGNYYIFEKHPPVAIDGKLKLPDRPGFGIVLDESKIVSRETITWRDL